MWGNQLPFESLVGKTLTKAEKIDSCGDDEIHFETTEGEKFKQYHSQDCCESVNVEDICGDLADLVGHPILMAEEVTSDTNPEGVEPKEYQDSSFTWTFYKLATIKGSVTIRWYGESNGYYSESVDFVRVED